MCSRITKTIIKKPPCVVLPVPTLGSPILIVVSVICRDQCVYYLYYVIVYVINIQYVRNTDNIRTDLYILLKPQSELGYLGSNYRTHKHI